MNYYKLIKKGYSVSPSDKLSIKSIELFNKCTQQKVVPIPSFTKIKDQQLYLSQIKINDVQAESLKQFLISQRDVSEFQIKSIFIVDCGMTDFQFSRILKGLRLQGTIYQSPFIKSILYQSGQLGELSCLEMIKIIEYINDLQFISLTGSGLQSKIVRILQTCNEKNLGLKKLKFSKTNLNDDKIVAQICKSLKYMSNLTSLALPWSSLSSKHMYQISESLNNNDNVIMNLNLAHNSLTFVEPFNNHKENFYNSQDFFQEICEYFQKTKFLMHLDISGLSFERKQMRILCPIFNRILTLAAIHLSDMGINQNFDDPQEDMMIELLDIFGISESSKLFSTQKLYQNVKNPTELQEVVKSHYQMSRQSNLGIQLSKLKRQIVMRKQSKLVCNNKVFNSSVTGQGVGRAESMPTDIFVLTRKINMPEMIFNNNFKKDLFWEIDSDSQWQLSYGPQNPSNECFLCQKHKNAMIFFDKCYENLELEEIKDIKIIEQVSYNLNLNNKTDDYAPIICGSVLNGGFKRKLQMLRSDFFTLLSMSQSELLINANNQERAIKKGVYMLATRSQNTQPQTVIDCSRGWTVPLTDKTLKNELVDVEAINFPKYLKDDVEPGLDLQGNWIKNKPCSSFVYSAFVAPGNHQFLIYLPERIIKLGDEEESGQLLPSGGLKDRMVIPAKLFVKSIIINLSSCDQFLQMPLYKTENQKQKTVAKVFRLWKPLSKEETENIIKTDCVDPYGGFDASLFMKDKYDVQNAIRILKNNFQMIQIVFQEMQAQTFVHSEGDYPLICFSVFYNSIREIQSSIEKQRKPFNRASIELCYQRAVRGEAGSRLKGQISRGKFLELILRCTNHFYQKETKISIYINEFLNDYIEPLCKRGKISDSRKIILNHKQLNNFLNSNLQGLQMIFDSKKNKRGFFTFESIQSIYPELPGIQQENLSQILKYNFVACQMTRFFDLEQPEKYDQIVFVEFLMFLGCLSLDYFKELQDPFAPCDLQDQCFELLKIIWVQFVDSQAPKVTSKKETGPKKRDRSKNKNNKQEELPFPELNIPIFEDNNEY